MEFITILSLVLLAGFVGYVVWQVTAALGRPPLMPTAKFLPSLILAASALACATPANAARRERPEQMTTIWLIQPGEPSQEPRPVHRGEAMLEQRLLPSGLATLDSAFDGGEAKRPLPAGTQLFLVVYRSAAVYCAFQYKPPNTLLALWSPTTTGTQLCFVDSDRDGRFEKHFVASNATPSLPGIYGPLPKMLKPMAPLAYSVAEPGAFGGDLSVSIVYTGKGLINNVRRYAIFFGSKDRRARLTSDEVSHGKDFPLRVEVLGASISVLSGSGQDIVVRVDRPVPPQPFGVVRTVSTVYY
ncbi:MAG: hypothetical protein ACXW2T_01840 [Allosphingosinicella sp.]